MFIKNIKLKNYRNYENTNIDLVKGLNIFVGNNAQGKTNLLESIYFSSIGKSPRTNKEKDLIKAGQELALIEISLEKEFNKTKINIYLNKQNKKTIKINNIPIKRIGELMGEMLIIYFSPDEIKLVKEAPQDRRRFLDIDISQLSKNYFYLLLRYEKIIDNRNKLLKEAKSFDVLKRTVSIWDEQLSDIASKIIYERLKFIEKLKEFSQKIHFDITQKAECLELSYQGIKEESVEKIKEKVLYALQTNIEKDYNLKYTSVGPHRDDIKILINGIDLRNFGSQGQQRLATLSIKLAELEIFKSEKNEKPILLLDDVLSELDENRQKQFLDKIKDIQTILTCTNYPYKPDANTKFFKIENGVVLK